MGLINWIFDIYQHNQIDKAREEAAEARREIAAVRRSGGNVDAERLERALGELALATKTLQRMMVEKGVCSTQEFGDMLRQVDLEDGRADGRAPI
jgi:hypothetical protein